MKIKQDKIIEIKSRIDIGDLISEYLTLKHTGASYTALCPFHNEKTPSFSVNRAKGFFYCFGCGASGDIFTFLQKIEGLSFPEALTKLADRAGVRLEEITDREAVEAAKKFRKQKMLFRINELANSFFRESFKNASPSSPGRQFLKDRHINDDAANTFQIGYAPDSWNALTNFLFNKKVPLDLAASIGLVKQKPGTTKDQITPSNFFDIFRDRIVFPVFDTSGKCYGFSCRTSNSKSETEKKGPKYINSPESEIYKKRESLFGIHAAYRHINSEDCIIVVEGNLDCISLSAAGFKNVVATLGTALTKSHVERIKRLTTNVVLIFDGDRAGRSATEKAFELFSAADITTVKTINLPEGNDPDSFIRENGPDTFKENLNKSEYIIDFLVNRELESISHPSPAEKATIYKNCEDHINKINDPLLRQAQYRYIEKKLELKNYNRTKKSTPTYKRAPTKSFKGDRAEEMLLRIILHYPLLNSPVFNKSVLSTEIFDKFSTYEYKITGYEFLKIFSELNFGTVIKGKEITPENYHTIITNILLTTTNNDNFSSVRQNLIELLRNRPEIDTNNINTVISDCISSIEAKNQKKLKTDLLKKIRKAEDSNDSNNMENLILEYEKLVRKSNVLPEEI